MRPLPVSVQRGAYAYGMRMVMVYVYGQKLFFPNYASCMCVLDEEGHTRMVMVHTRMGSGRLCAAFSGQFCPVWETM